MKKSGGVHEPLGIRLVDDWKIGAQESMVGKIALRNLLSPFRGIIIQRLADGWRCPEQARSDPCAGRLEQDAAPAEGWSTGFHDEVSGFLLLNNPLSVNMLGLDPVVSYPLIKWVGLGAGHVASNRNMQKSAPSRPTLDLFH
jgi:hypothetical protein